MNNVENILKIEFRKIPRNRRKKKFIKLNILFCIKTERCDINQIFWTKKRLTKNTWYRAVCCKITDKFKIGLKSNKIFKICINI